MSNPREIRLTNTQSGKKEVLKTIEPGKLRFYSCGPTVWGLIHIGNLRAGLVADHFVRYFRRAGYDVTFVRNYTDVDDKIIDRGHQDKMPPEEVAKKFTVEAEKDYAVAGMLEPDHKTRVTEHIPEIIAMIEKIIQNGKAYVVPSGEGGEVLFSIAQFPGYGKLSGKNLEELEAGARVEVDPKKRNPLDFALWKPAKAGEPYWDSPWGKGRPGWHIECSAMAHKWLGVELDVHHGGADLAFPHHENEIAQTEAATGHSPFVRYWVHNAFLTLSKTKMSKSLGNVFTAREFLTQFSGEFARYLLLSVHYRHPIDFGDETIDQTIAGLTRIYEAKSRAVALQRGARRVPDQRAEAAWGEFLACCEKAKKEIDDHYANDLNTAGALGALFSLIRDFNRTLSVPLAEATPAAHLGAQTLVQIIEDDIGSVIGVGRQEPSKGLADLERIKLVRLPTAGAATAGRPQEAEILQLIEERKTARASKNFARADEIRKGLEAKGVLIKDNPSGQTTWEYK